MTKKHEELVEEILHLCDTIIDDEELAQRLITLILSAVRDGRLGLPGEVGRTTYRFGQKGIGLGCRKGDIIIALRPLTGTGKEEE